MLQISGCRFVDTWCFCIILSSKSSILTISLDKIKNEINEEYSYVCRSLSNYENYSIHISIIASEMNALLGIFSGCSERVWQAVGLSKKLDKIHAPESSSSRLRAYIYSLIAAFTVSSFHLKSISLAFFAFLLIWVIYSRLKRKRIILTATTIWSLL